MKAIIEYPEKKEVQYPYMAVYRPAGSPKKEVELFDIVIISAPTAEGKYYTKPLNPSQECAYTNDISGFVPLPSGTKVTIEQP